MGDVGAHYDLSVMYHHGQGVETNEKKKLHHSEQAAIGGHHMARCNLAYEEAKKCRIERAVKHFIIAANLEHDTAIRCSANFI